MLCILEMIDSSPKFAHIACIRTLVSPLTDRAETSFKEVFYLLVHSNDNSFGQLYKLLRGEKTEDFSAQLAQHIRAIAILKNVAQEDNIHLIHILLKI